MQKLQRPMLPLDSRISVRMPSSSSSRILDILCKVCGDYSSGKHYNIYACDGCAGFFKRSIRKSRRYVCKNKAEGMCIIDKAHRNQCRACRLVKCEKVGMNKDAVQHERGPRNSTLRRQQAQQAHLFGDGGHQRFLGSPGGPVLDLVMPRPGATPPRMEPTLPIVPPATFLCSPATAVPRLTLGIPAPAPMIPPIINPATMCETAARLVFMNVHWAKNVPEFAALCLSDQLLLLEESWCELFVLGAAIFLMPLELGSLVNYCGILERGREKVSSFLNEVKEFQETLSRITQFRVDIHELACLRAIVLFKTSFDSSNNNNNNNNEASPSTGSRRRTLADAGAVASLQDRTQLTLNQYISAAYPGQPLRFAKLLLLLPSLRNVSSDTIEELFFRRTIDVPIVRAVTNMYLKPNIL